MTPDEHLTTFERRILADVLRTATASYWNRRAAEFEAAKPRPDEFHGNATRDELSAAWRRCDDAARACRARAEVAPFDDVAGEVETVLREAA